MPQRNEAICEHNETCPQMVRIETPKVRNKTGFPLSPLAVQFWKVCATIKARKKEAKRSLEKKKPKLSLFDDCPLLKTLKTPEGNY